LFGLSEWLENSGSVLKNFSSALNITLATPADVGNKIAGALYVLKGDAYVRISIGGPTDAATKRRAKALAQKAIARL
jgi:hypothetical protein